MADNKMLLEFAARVDSSVKASVDAVTSAINKLNFNTAKLNDAIKGLAESNKRGATAAHANAQAMTQATAATSAHSAASQRAIIVSDQYQKQLDKVNKKYKEGSAERGNALRALQKTEDAWKRETRTLRSQEGALQSLTTKLRELQEVQSMQTTKRGMDSYTRKIAAVEKGMAGIQTAMSTSTKELEKSFNYGGRFADELRKVQQSYTGLSKAQRMFANEVAPIQQIASRIASTTAVGSLAQLRALQQLKSMSTAYGSEMERVNLNIRAAQEGLTRATGETRKELERTIATEEKRKAVLTGMMKDPIKAFEDYRRGVSEVSKGMSTLVMRGTEFGTVMTALKDRLKGGAITKDVYKEQAASVVKADRAMQALGTQYNMTREQVAGLTRAYGAENLVTAARNGTLTQSIRMMKEQEGLAKKSRTDFSFAGDIVASMKSLVSYSVAGGALYGVFNAFSSGAQAIKEYSQALKDLKAITQAADRDVAMLGATILEITSKYKFSLTEVVSAATIIGQAGFSATDTIRVLNSAMTLAQGTMSDIKQTTDLITTAMTSFQSEGLGAAAAADMLAQAVNKSKLDIEKLRTIFNYVGPVATDAGISFQETSAALMVLANQGMRASTIGTSLRNIFSRLQSPSAALTKIFKEQGVEITSISDKSIPLVERFRTLGKVLGTNADLYALFGLRAAGAVSILMRFPDQVDAMYQSMYRMGLAEEMAATQMEGLSNKILNLKAKLQVLAVTAGEEAGQGFGFLIDILAKLTEALTVFADSAYGKALLSMTAFAGGAALVVGGVTILVKVMGMLAAPIAGAISGLATMTVGMSALGPVTAATAAQMGYFNAALMLIARHPIIAVLTTIAALVGIVGTAFVLTADKTAKAREEQDRYIQKRQEELAVLERAAKANAELGDDETTRLMNRNYVMEKVLGAQSLAVASTKDDIQKKLEELTATTQQQLEDAVVARIQDAAKQMRDARDELQRQQELFIEKATAASTKGGPRPSNIALGFSSGGDFFDQFKTIDDTVAAHAKGAKRLSEIEEGIRADLQQRSNAIALATKGSAGGFAEYERQMLAFSERVKEASSGQEVFIDSSTRMLVEIQRHVAEINGMKGSLSVVSAAFKEMDSGSERLLSVYSALSTGARARFTEIADNYQKSLDKMKLSGDELASVRIQKQRELAAKLLAISNEDFSARSALNKLAMQREIDTVREASDSKEEFKKKEAEIVEQYAEREYLAMAASVGSQIRALMEMQGIVDEIDGKQIYEYIGLIISGDISGLPPVIQDFLQGSPDAVKLLQGLSNVGSSLNRAMTKEKFGSGGGRGGFAREERRRMDAMKAELDAKQARNELAYEKGQYGEGLAAFRAYTFEKLEIERQMLGARKALAASMMAKASGAEDKATALKESQQLAKEEAEFELKYLKEVRTAEFKLIDEKALAIKDAADRELALIDRNSIHYMGLAKKENDVAVQRAQANIDALKEKLEYEMNAVERAQLQNDLTAAETSMLEQQVRYKEKIYELTNKYLDYEYRMGIRSSSEYADHMRTQGRTGAMNPYKAEQEALLATGNVLDMLAVGFQRVKESASTFGETVASVATKINDGIGSAVDIMVDSWHDGTKDMAQQFSDLATSVVKDMQKMMMKQFINMILYGGAGEGGGGTMGTGGLLGSVMGGLTGLFRPSAEKPQAASPDASAADSMKESVSGAMNSMANTTAQANNAMVNNGITAAQAQTSTVAGAAATSTNIFANMGSGLLNMVSGIGSGVFNILSSIAGGLGGGGGGGGGLGGLIGGLVSGVMGGFFGGGSGASLTGIGTAGYTNPSFQMPNIGGNFSVSTFHTGGVVRRVNPSYGSDIPASVFANAPRLHNGGRILKPGEQAAILQEGEEVLTERQRRERGGGQDINFSVQVNNYAKASVEEKKTPNASGGFDLELMVKDLDRAIGGLVGKGESSIATNMDKSRGTSPARSLYNT